MRTLSPTVRGKLQDIFSRVRHDAVEQRKQALDDLEAYYNEALVGYRGGNLRQLDRMRARIFPIDLIRVQLTTWKQVTDDQARKTVVRSMYFPALSLVLLYFDDFKNFVLEAVQDPSAHVRNAARHIAGWLKLPRTIGSDLVAAEERYQSYRAEVESFVKKYYREDMSLTEYAGDLKPSVFKSLVLLWFDSEYRGGMRSHNAYQRLYRKSFGFNE